MVIDWDDPVVVAALPDEAAVSAITLAELAVGSHLASSSHERARRQASLQQVEATFEPLPFEVTAARSLSLAVAAVTETGRTRRRRVADLLIAATAHANRLPLHTRNSGDFSGLSELIEVISI